MNATKSTPGDAAREKIATIKARLALGQMSPQDSVTNRIDHLESLVLELLDRDQAASTKIQKSNQEPI
jgi:hypothetical protein